MEAPAHPTLTQSHPADKSIFAVAQPSCPQGWFDRGRFGEEHPAVTKISECTRNVMASSCFVTKAEMFRQEGHNGHKLGGEQTRGDANSASAVGHGN